MSRTDTAREPADPAALARYLLAKAAELAAADDGATPKRYIIALTGIPGSGKSTFSDRLIQHLNAAGSSEAPACAVLVPMDGFHRTQAELAADPDPDFSFRRRGAPFTFNPDALLSLVHRIRTTPSLTAPSFSHAKKDPVEGDVKIEPHHRIVLVEGTFLMLNEAPWSSIAQEVDERWFYDVPEEVALQRVVQRHIAAGLAADRQAAEAKALANDVLNAQLVLSKLITPDKTLYEVEAPQ